jgi:hypothetical protein
MFRAIVFFGLTTSAFAGAALDVLVNAAASFSATIQQLESAEIGVETKVRFAPPSEPDWQISCILCAPAHKVRNVVFPLMWC